ncbi:MAG: MFS transporter [archaeon]|nr:MFS transporter [archaeon]
MVDEKLKKNTKIGYITTAIPIMMPLMIVTVGHVDYFQAGLGLSYESYTLAMLIYAFINAFNDPLVAIMSDRTDRKRWGSRRIIYIRWAGLLTLIVFALGWIPWGPYGDQIMIFFQLLLFMSAFDTGFSLIMMCWMALLPEMTDDVDTRVKLSAYVLPIQIVAMIGAMIVVNGTIGNEELFKTLTIIVAVFCAIMLFVNSRVLFEREEWKGEELLPFWDGIKETIKSRSYLLYIGYGFFANVLTRAISMGLMMHMVAYYDLSYPGLGLPLYFLLGLIMPLFGAIIATKAQPKWGIRGALFRLTFIEIIGTLIFFILGFGSSMAIFIMIGHAWTSIFGAGHMVYLQTIQTLSMDEDEIKTGTRRETTFLGVNALFTKPADSFGPILGIGILVSFGWVTSAGLTDIAQHASTWAYGAMILILLVPIVCRAIGMIFLYFWPLHGENLIEMRLKLSELHDKRKADYEKQISISSSES